MQRLTRVAIQLEEATRLAKLGDDEYHRLALILTDNAVELILYRHAWIKLREEEQQRERVRVLVGRDDLPEALVEYRDSTLAPLMSRNSAKRLEREFSPKVDLAEEEGLISSAESVTIKKLHEYRNETQHRDSIRSETLSTSVQIYIWLACELYAVVPIHSVGLLGPADAWPPVFRRVVGEDIALEHDPFALPKKFSDALLAGLSMESAHVGEVLGANLLSRLQTIQEGLNYISENSIRNDDEISTSYLFHLLQIKGDLGVGWLDAAVVEATPVPHKLSIMTSWIARAEELQRVPDSVDAFAEYSAVEDELEDVEKQIREAVVGLDVAINNEVDRRFGN